MLSPNPHRSGRAQLTHPAPHSMVSLRDYELANLLSHALGCTTPLPSEVSLRYFQVSMSLASFPPKVPSLWRPLPSTGSLRVGSPASTVLFDAPTPCHPSPQASLPSPSDTASVPVCFAPIVEQTPPTISQGLISGLPIPVLS